MTRIAFPPFLLGAAGLIPPAGLALAAWFDIGGFGPVATGFLFTYTALIFAFLGGTWWAFACREERPRFLMLLVAVAPPLLAWVWLALNPQTLVGYGLASLALLSLLVDALLRRRGLTPDWWMTLRVPLSLGLALCTAAATFASAR